MYEEWFLLSTRRPSVHKPQESKFVRGDRKIAHSLPRGVIDGIGDRCARAGDPNFPDASRPQLRIKVGVRTMLNEQGLKLGEKLSILGREGPRS